MPPLIDVGLAGVVQAVGASVTGLIAQLARTRIGAPDTGTGRARLQTATERAVVAVDIVQAVGTDIAGFIAELARARVAADITHTAGTNLGAVTERAIGTARTIGFRIGDTIAGGPIAYAVIARIV